MSARPRASSRARRGAGCRARRGAGAARAARDRRTVTRDTHHRPPPSVRSRQAPAIAPVACSRRMPVPHASVASRPSRTAPPSHPPYITPSSQTPPFPHIIPYALPPFSPAPAPAPDPVERHRTPDPVRSNPVDPRFHRVLRQPSAQRPQPTRANPSAQPNGSRAPTERNPLIRGKPFLTASNAPADYGELPPARTSPERIEGVSRSLPYSDLLALTSSHMFFSVMN